MAEIAERDAGGALPRNLSVQELAGRGVGLPDVRDVRSPACQAKNAIRSSHRAKAANRPIESLPQGLLDACELASHQHEIANRCSWSYLPAMIMKQSATEQIKIKSIDIQPESNFQNILNLNFLKYKYEVIYK